MTNFSAQIDAMNMQAWELVRSDPRQAVSLGKQAYQLATQEEPAGFPYLKGAVEGLRTEARVYLYEGNYEQALELSLNALTLADGIGPLEAQPHILYTIASVYRLLGDLATSLDYYLKQRQASEQLNQRLDIATALVGIGTLYGDQEDYTQAWAYFEQGLSIFEELKNSYWMAHVRIIFFLRFSNGGILVLAWRAVLPGWIFSRRARTSAERWWCIIPSVRFILRRESPNRPWRMGLLPWGWRLR